MEVLLLPLQRRDLCAMRFVALVGTQKNIWGGNMNIIGGARWRILNS